MKKLFYFISATIVVLLASCQPRDVDADKMFLSESDLAQMLSEESDYVMYDATNGGLNQFLADYMTEKGNYLSDTSVYRSRATNGNGIYLFSIDTLPSKGKGIYIRGRITTDDLGGNFYKAMAIQQLHISGSDTVQQALRLSVDAGNASGMYVLGQEIVIRVNGFAIGRYANQPQLCVPSYNNNIYAQNYTGKIGWAPGRIPSARFQMATTRIGMPDVSKLYYEELILDSIVTTSNSSSDGYGKSLKNPVEARLRDGKLVRIKNVHFTGEYAIGTGSESGKRATCTTGNPEEDENANVFGPTTGNVGYPQSRVITDGKLYTQVSTSEYAKYAHMYLPAAEYIGTVEGILGFYMDNAGYSETWKTWSISLRDLNDVRLFNAAGEQWIPQEYSAE